MDITQQIQQAVSLINQASNVVAMTGAGISTPSGIPDFRSPNSGLWQQADPLRVASIHAFRQNPEAFYNWIHPVSRKFLEAEPNAAHRALAELEHKGKLTAIITQNIDNLHTRAGSQTIHELHGHLREGTCIDCGRVQDLSQMIRQFVADGQIPRCTVCGGVLKPNAILFGENLPMETFVNAQVALAAADLLLIVGSSLEVSPASDLPRTALDNQAKIIIINLQPTYLDDRADVVIHHQLAEVLPAIVNDVTA